MKQQTATYQAYLLRLWLIDEGEKCVWRATLENAQNRERISLSSVDELLTYLTDTTKLIAAQIEARNTTKKHN